VQTISRKPVDFFAPLDIVRITNFGQANLARPLTAHRSNTMDITTQISDNVDTVTQTLVDANDRVLDTVVTVNKRLVDSVVEMADRAPNVDMPFADRLPTPAENGKRYIDFVERAVSVNRDFTARLVAQLPTGVAAPAKAKATTQAKKSTPRAKKTSTAK